MSRMTWSGSRVMAKVRAGSRDTLNDVLGMWWRGIGGMGSKE